MKYPDGMSESETTSTAADLEALKALQADASELERLEKLLDRLNFFEAYGFVNNEVMHSEFLAFLFDPKRNDGLKDLPIKGLLREALVTARKTRSSPEVSVISSKKPHPCLTAPRASPPRPRTLPSADARQAPPCPGSACP